ncbi:MAG: hypothetical protein RL227_108 [Pseudomonadota bacterium]
MAKAAVLPVGREVRLHWKLSASPSGSLLARPSRRTRLPKATVWAVPARATGGAG